MKRQTSSRRLSRKLRGQSRAIEACSKGRLANVANVSVPFPSHTGPLHPFSNEHHVHLSTSMCI